MDFPQNMSMEEAFALAEAEAKLNQALSESKSRFENAVLPNRLNEDWRFGRPHKYAAALAEQLLSDTPSQGEAEVEHAGEAAVPVNADDEDLRQTEMLMPTIGSDALLGMHLERFGNGYALYIEEDTNEPIVIRYKTNSLYTPSTYIMVAPGVKAHIIEQHYGSEKGTIFATRNIQVAEGAELKVELTPYGCARSMVITNIQNMGGKVAHYSHYFACDWAREETLAEIYTPGSDIQLFSANHLDHHQVIDQHTRQIHHVGNATSNLLYKNVVDDSATAIFAGNIYVAPGAHHTDAYQSNRNMLLSEKATVHSLPGLEILADKVRCSHGSASAPMDEEQLFYLLSRGIPRADALNLVAYGFLQDVVDKFNRS
ncbi:MAG: SufD family Fe-S cluster assembly protein [Akkermansia sp.]|nr:SufD family Fe-S cluster assembly protein [Akkermansia sp.]